MATELEREFLEHFPACFDYILEHISPTKSVNEAYLDFREEQIEIRNYMKTRLTFLLVSLARSKNPIFRQWFELLISLGLDINENRSGVTSLYTFQYFLYSDDSTTTLNTDFKDQYICKRLIEEGINILPVDPVGTNMLTLAASDIIAMTLIEAGIVTNGTNDWSPFLVWFLVAIGHRPYLTPKKCKMFLHAGVDPKIKDYNGNTILKILAMYDRLQGDYMAHSPMIVKEVLKPIENTCMIDMIVECLS